MALQENLTVGQMAARLSEFPQDIPFMHVSCCGVEGVDEVDLVQVSVHQRSGERGQWSRLSICGSGKYCRGCTYGWPLLECVVLPPHQGESVS